MPAHNSADLPSLRMAWIIGFGKLPTRTLDNDTTLSALVSRDR